MKRNLKVFFSFFMLALFLFPAVCTEVHNFHHGDELHCNDLSSHHFHQEEHHCTICDSIPTFTENQIHPLPVKAESVVVTLTVPILIDFHLVAPTYSFSLRGPPLFS